jgi:hypothetical protein
MQQGEVGGQKPSSGRGRPGGDTGPHLLAPVRPTQRPGVDLAGEGRRRKLPLSNRRPSRPVLGLGDCGVGCGAPAVRERERPGWCGRLRARVEVSGANLPRSALGRPPALPRTRAARGPGPAGAGGRRAEGGGSGPRLPGFEGHGVPWTGRGQAGHGTLLPGRGGPQAGGKGTWRAFPRGSPPRLRGRRAWRGRPGEEPSAALGPLPCARLRLATCRGPWAGSPPKPPPSASLRCSQSCVAPEAVRKDPAPLGRTLRSILVPGLRTGSLRPPCQQDLGTCPSLRKMHRVEHREGDTMSTHSPTPQCAPPNPVGQLLAAPGPWTGRFHPARSGVPRWVGASPHPGVCPESLARRLEGAGSGTLPASGHSDKAQRDAEDKETFGSRDPYAGYSRC